MQFGGGKHEIDMSGWFFEGLQQGVEGLGGEHVHFIDDEDFVPGTGGQEANFFFQLTDFLDAAVGGAVNFLKVHAGPFGDSTAGTAGVAGLCYRTILAIKSLGHNARQGRFTGTANSAEDQGMGHAILGKCVLQGTDNRSLANYFGKSLRTGFSGKDKIGQGGYQQSMIRKNGGEESQHGLGRN